MPVKSVKLGPGTLTFGPVGTPMDASCQLANGVVTWDKNKDDDLTVLCGDVISGATTYTAKLSGTMVQDLDAGATSLVAWSWTNKGTEVDFEYTPNTAAGASVSGKCIVDPLDVGTTDDYGSTMTSDFEYDCVGEPNLGFGTTGTLAVGADDGDRFGTAA